MESYLEPLSHSTIQNTPLNLTTNPNINPTNPQFPSPTQYNIPTHFEDKASPQEEGNVKALDPRDSKPTRQKNQPLWMKDCVWTHLPRSLPPNCNLFFLPSSLKIEFGINRARKSDKAKGVLAVRVPMKALMATLGGAGCGDDGSLDRERLLGEPEFEVILQFLEMHLDLL
ncbi:hypothetical protein VNO80_22748 [Phaseolus coccineus]|uniref:Uncharacterized protein n=1 Tax=Phaseolus coccineus TaxID=3886 RepID=A0AAN9QZ14_PHACN